MGHWGVRSHENDDCADVLDAALERVHGATHEELMDDRNPLDFDEVQRRLANPQTLAVALDILRESVGPDRPWDDWDDAHRLAYVGIVTRHAEFGVPIPDDCRARALEWLEHERIEWDEATLRKLRRAKEISLLRDSTRTES